MQPGDADVGHQRDLAVPRLGRDPGLLGDGQVAGPGRHDHDLAELRPRVARGAGSGRSGPSALCSPSGKARLQVRGGRRLDPGDQPPLAVREQGPQDPLDLLGGLALAEDDLGEPATDAAMEVDLGEPARLLERAPSGARVDGLGGRRSARADRLEQLRQARENP